MKLELNNFQKIESSFKQLSIDEKSISEYFTIFKELSFDDKTNLVNNILSDFYNNYKSIPKGNSNLRISGLLEKDNGIVFLFEYYFEDNTLNSYRRLLDAIALYSSNYNIDYKKITPIIVFHEIPNKRVDMWLALEDIENVLEIEFKLLTVFEIYFIKKFHLNFGKILEYSGYKNVREGFVENKLKKIIGYDGSELPIFKPIK